MGRNRSAEALRPPRSAESTFELTSEVKNPHPVAKKRDEDGASHELEFQVKSSKVKILNFSL
jgi:hypothetical protein